MKKVYLTDQQFGLLITLARKELIAQEDSSSYSPYIPIKHLKPRTRALVTVLTKLWEARRSPQ